MPGSNDNDCGILTPEQRLILKHCEFVEYLQSPEVKKIKRYSVETNRFGAHVYVVEYDAGGDCGILSWPVDYQDGCNGYSDDGREGNLNDLDFLSNS